MFKVRVLSGIVIAALMLLCAWLGGAYLLALLLLVSLVGLYEFYHATGLLDGKYIDFLTAVGYAGTIIYYVAMGCFPGLFASIFTIVLVLVVLMAVYVFTFPKYTASSIVFAFFGFFYVSVMLGFIYMTRALDQGIYLVWLIFFASWFCDVFAYFTGMLIGKHKLAPVLSPKKSVEGAVGGIVFPAIFGAIYGYCINKYAAPGFPAMAFTILTAIGAAVSQVGDLSASAIKRNHDIKDYGNIIPGHGGILDRFDSVIFTAPMIYFTAGCFLEVFWKGL
ncbi:MAG: phosphatidate cytidylyltransferase [Lachnospiraceae bacterium]|nr:phosphatidate cytidylyltransferase [Lachnospiraceae bacterium]